MLDFDPIAHAYTDDTQGVIERAVAQGLKVIYPVDDELQIDIDDDASGAHFEEIWPMFANIVGGAYVKSMGFSKSGPPKRHIVVKMPYAVDETERLLLQTILGSDARRELFGYRRVKNGITPVTIFIEPAIDGGSDAVL